MYSYGHDLIPGKFGSSRQSFHEKRFPKRWVVHSVTPDLAVLTGRFDVRHVGHVQFFGVGERKPPVRMIGGA